MFCNSVKVNKFINMGVLSTTVVSICLDSLEEPIDE